MKFNNGDKVKVIKSISTGRCAWVSHAMDEFVVKTVTITGTSDYGNYFVKETEWVFPLQSLSLSRKQTLFDFMYRV